MAPEQIALLVLAILGFVLAAMFLFGVFENKELSERELCRISILSRATISGIIENAAPLNCFTEKICLTPKKSFLKSFGGSEKSSCKQFAGEINVRAVEVVVDNNPEHQKESADIIQREVANAMFDCWAMTGQGKLDIWSTGGGIDLTQAKGIFNTLGLTVKKLAPHCIVCSRVAFSDDFFSIENSKNNNEVLARIDFNSFFSKEKVPGSSLTYLQTFTDESVGSGLMTDSKINHNILAQSYGKNDLSSDEINQIKNFLKSKIPDGEDIPSELDDEIKLKEYFGSRPLPVDSRQMAIVFAQMKVSSEEPNDVFWKTLKKGAVMGGVSLGGAANSLISLTPLAKVAKFAIELVALGAVSTTLAYKAEGITVANQALSAAVCGSLESKDKDKDKDVKGCSFVKLMDWSADNLNTLCSGGIEGNI